VAFRRHKVQARAQFYGPRRWRILGGHVWEDGWKEHITAARTSGRGAIGCFKKILAGTNKHYLLT